MPRLWWREPEPTAAPLPVPTQALNIYYAQQQRHAEHKAFAATMSQLEHYVDSAIVGPFEVDLAATAKGFNATVSRGTGENRLCVRVREDRFVQVVQEGACEA